MTRRLPEAFEKEFCATFGPELFSRVARSLTEEEPVTSLRINRLKACLIKAEADPVSWLPEQGTYIPGDRPVFGADPLWHAGSYYVQEAASMFLAQYLQGEKPEIVLDLCAAPGGKSTLLRDFFTPDAGLSAPLLVANEPMRDRAVVLRENLLRWGADETIITSAFPRDLAGSGLRADIILVDAPCSGEGMFRKDPGSIVEWTPENVGLCVSRQRKILTAAWEMLREGGLLVYSTCTLNPRENEDQLSWLEEHYPLQLVTLSSEWDDLCLRRRGVYRFMPGVTRSEGLTIFAVRKLSESIRTRTVRLPKAPKLQIPDALKALPQSFYAFDGKLSLLSDRGKETLARLQSAKGIRILSAGLPLGETKGNDFLPAQGWVSSGVFSGFLPFPRLEIMAEQALALLKKENPLIEAPGKGLFLLANQGLPLTLIKHLGNRYNCFYPKEWAIRNAGLTASDIPGLPIRIKDPL